MKSSESKYRPSHHHSRLLNPHSLPPADPRFSFVELFRVEVNRIFRAEGSNANERERNVELVGDDGDLRERVDEEEEAGLFDCSWGRKWVGTRC